MKSKLIQAPVLAYPQFNMKSPPFVLQTDASIHGVGAILEQGDCVIAYASRILNRAEQQYIMILKKCLAITFTQ